MNEQRPAPRQQYRHFKSEHMRYEIVGIALHTETGEDMVVYKPLYETDHAFFARPLAMFFEEVENAELGYKGPRFIRIEDA